MFCTNCGTKINDGDSFCTNCGSKISYESLNSDILSLEEQIKKTKVVAKYSAETSVDDIDAVKFGSYPQNDVSGKTKEPIDWLVLDMQNDRALLLSKYIIDCKKMVSQYEKGSDQNFWGTSELRNWLNNYFLGFAFNEEERKKIMLSDIDTFKDLQSYGVPINIKDGHSKDKIFLLSVDEVDSYFAFPYSDNIVKKYATKPTQYAITNGMKGEFWLRDSGSRGCYDNYIFITSNIIGRSFGQEHRGDEGNIGVRPVMWVKI